MQNSVEYKRFVWEFENIIDQNKYCDNFIFLCIGTTSIIGDSFGPIVGRKLKEKLCNTTNIKIIGDFEKCITYNDICTNRIFKNSIFTNDNIYTDKFYECRITKEKNLIIALDSALSLQQNIGKVFVHNRGLKYAESLKKRHSIIGDISIKAVVGENRDNCLQNFNILKNASYERIEKMSSLVSKGIVEVMYKKNNIGKNICK